MILFPAIDLKDGQCVRLYQGCFEEKTVYGKDPAAVAARWAEEGATWLHLVDLDGSIGDSAANCRALVAIRQAVPLKLQLGGGIRSLETADHWFGLGLNRLILGTVVCENPKLAAKIAGKYPGRVAVALDAVGEDIRVRGWKEAGGRNLFETAASLADMGAAMVIYTDVERDGTQAGPNVENTREVARVSKLPTICSGGIATIEDVKAVKILAASGVAGVISGKALYEGTLDFKEGKKILET